MIQTNKTIEQNNINLTVTVERIGFFVSTETFVKGVKKAEDVVGLVGSQTFTVLCPNRIEDSILNRRVKKLTSLTGLVAGSVKTVLNSGFNTEYKGVEFTANTERFNLLNDMF